MNTNDLISYALDGSVAFDLRGVPLMTLPEGFRYWVVSWTGQTMSDGSRVPGDHDGMAAFAVRRHHRAGAQSRASTARRNSATTPASTCPTA
jgi:secreted PhoX family phosphatase